MRRIISINDLNTDEGSGYTAVLEYSYSQPPLAISSVNREGDAPLATNVALGQYRPERITVSYQDPALRRPLLRALDTLNGAVAFTLADDDDDTPRYMMLHVEKVDQQPDTHGYMFNVTTVAAEDVRWRDAEEQTVSWNATSSGSWTETDNDGDLDTYPVWKVTPRSTKSTAPNFKYSRSVIVRWQALNSTTGLYPINLTGDAGLNTAALVTAGKVIDSSDICVMVDGVVWPHWFGATEGQAKGFNSTSTYIWVNLSFPRIAAVVAAESTAADATTIYFNPYLSSNYASTPPASGRIYVPDTGEIFYYGSLWEGNFDEIQRGVGGTTAADIPAHTHLEYLPHEIYILYGPNMIIPETLKRYNYDESLLRQKPLIVNPNSTNSVWEYTTFRDGARTAEWRYIGERGGNQYTQETDETGVAGDFVEPWTAMGFLSDHDSFGMYDNYFPVPVQIIDFTVRRIANGFQAANPGSPVLRVASENRQTIYRPFSAAAGASTIANNAISHTADFTSNFTGYRKDYLQRIQWAVENKTYVQADLQYMKVTFWSTRVPLVTVGAETSDYDLALRLENYTTGEYLDLYLPNMELDKSLIIDSYLQTAVYNGDGSNQYAAVRRNAPRAKFLRLVPGINNIRVYEEGLTDVDIDVTYRRRFYS